MPHKPRLTLGATLLSAAMAAAPALASPAGMALSSRGSKSAAPVVTPGAVTSLQEYTERPSARISPVKNPIQYLAATISEMPLSAKNKLGSANPVMPPVQKHDDAISLSKPVGAPTPQLFISAAQICESHHDIEKARANYQQALTMWPGQVDVLRAAARMEDRLGQLGVAESLYRQAVAANPQHAGAHNDLGLCLARQRKLEESVQEIEQAIQLQPTKALYRNNAATVLVEMREDQRAIAHLAAVHGAAEANYNFGQLLVQRGRPADATQYFQAAVEQNPQMQPARVALAKLNPNSAPAFAETPAAGPAPASPPATAEQQLPTGPQLNYPSAAYAPTGAPVYVPPKYLPPVAQQPGVIQR